MTTYFEFEKPIAELENRIRDLRQMTDAAVDVDEEVSRLEGKANELLT
ncbi:MAG: acetyl-CoA carboxylase carboxyl transferase subunit alpha, partial [Pseudomonadota bacterium]